MYFENLKWHKATAQSGAAIETIGEDSFVVFVTQDGHFLPVSGRVLGGDDLLQAYAWGYEAGKKAFNGTTDYDPQQELEDAYYRWQERAKGYDEYEEDYDEDEPRDYYSD